jgi:enoyl-CoA hydratase
MPETGIGFFPDVGGSYFLPRCPGEIGMYLALTSARLKTDDTRYAGVSTLFVPQTNWGFLLDALADRGMPQKPEAKIWREPSPLAEHRAKIDCIFAADSVKAILAGLDAESDDWSRETAATIRTKSPTSLKIAFRELREGKLLSFDDCMRMEFRIASRVLAGHDFFEGVRAVLIDKDGAAKWRPASLGEVTDEAVAAYFAPLGENELPL